MFENFHVPSSTDNVIDFNACRARRTLYEIGAVDASGNFFVDQQPFNPDWVAEYRRSGFFVVRNEVEIDFGSNDH